MRSSPGIGHNGSILAGAVLISCFPTSTLRSQTKWYRGHDNKQERDSRVPGERPPRRGGTPQVGCYKRGDLVKIIGRTPEQATVVFTL